MESTGRLNWDIAISSGIFLDEPLIKTLASLRDAGFRLLEISGKAEHFNYRDISAISKAKQEINRLGLQVISLHAPFIDIDITSLDENSRQNAVDEVQASIKALAALGGTSLVIHVGSESEEAKKEASEHLNQSVLSLMEIYDFCTERNIKLVAENMLAHLVGGRKGEMESVLNRLPGMDIGICLDTGHGFLAGSLMEKAKELGSSIRMIHIHDNHGTFDDHLPPGEGLINWQKFLETLGSIRFQGKIVLEVRGGNGDSSILKRGWQSVQRLKEYCEGKPYDIDIPD